MPWPISTIGITRVTTPSRSIRMKAFGANVPAAAIEGRNASGIARLMTSPPATAAPVLRKLRRPSRIGGHLCGAMDCGADALIRAAAADVAGHRGIDVGIARLRRGREQRHGRHDLARLAIAALHDLEVEPRLLHRFALRRLANGFDGGDGLVADAA